MVTLKKLKNGIQSRLSASWWSETWREGFFSGNGKTGINVFGGALNEKILINSADLNWQGKVSVLPDLGTKIREVKKLVDENNLEDAQNVFTKALIQKNFRPQPFCSLPLCVLNIDFKAEKTPKDYSRMLNSSNGEITVNFVDGPTRFSRSTFVSRADDYIVCELTKTGQKQIDVELSLDIMDKINARTPVGMSAVPEGIFKKYETNFMYFSAHSDDGTEFGTVAKVTFYGGSMEIRENSLFIKGANSVLIVAKTFANSYKEKEFKILRALLASNKDTYDKMLKKHTAIHQKAMDSVSVSLDNTDDWTEELLSQCNLGEISAKLAEKMWNYGRYLLYCSTDKEGKIVLPNGLFNGNFKAVENNVSFETKTPSSYFSVFAGDMMELLEPLFIFAEQNMPDMRDNAMRLFGVRGLFLPSVTAGVTARVGSTEPDVLHFTGCAGILASLFFDYYLYTGDTKFLKNRALPFMKEVAVFYEEFFKLDRFGFYEANPSYSPMSAKGDKTKGIYINKDATIDFAIARELLTNMIQGASSANMYLDEIDKWKDMLTKIPSPAIQDDGSLRDYAADTSDYTTAGVAALYSALVSKEVDFLTDDEAIKPYLISARKKLAESYNYQTSLTLINLARVFIRLQQRQQAVECLTNAINYCGLNNLALSFCDWRNNGVVGFDVWSPLQLSTNMAFTAAIQEMLLYSKEGVIKILPCIPDGWKNIEVEGLKAVDALTVKISLNEKNILNVDIKARKNANFDLYLPDNVKRLKKSGEYALTINENVYIKGIKLSAGKTVSFSFVCA